jgi:hypothetical protein
VLWGHRFAFARRGFGRGPGVTAAEVEAASSSAGEQPGGASSCCGVTACCTHDEAPLETGVTAIEAKTAAGCGCLEHTA